MIVDLTGIKVVRVSTVPFFLIAQLSAQIRDLAAAGAQVRVITSAGPNLDTLVSERVSVEVIDIARSMDPWKDFIALVKLVRSLRAYRPHIVHSTTPKAGLLCAVAGLIARVPVRLHTFTGQPWVQMRGLMRGLTRAADRLIGRCATHVYADSPSQARFLIDEGIIPAAQISVMGHGSLAGVDLKRFDPTRWTDAQKQALRQSLGLAPQSALILFVGRLTQDKGIDELLAAFQWLRDAGTDADLLLVGPIDNERGEGVKVNGARIHHVNYTPNPEQYMAIADVLCLPSYREGFGTVVIEAAAMGLPTVGTRIDGLIDAIQDGVTGTLVPPRHVAALTQAIERMLTDPAFRLRLGVQARARCVELFDSDTLSRHVAKAYQCLVKRGAV